MPALLYIIAAGLALLCAFGVSPGIHFGWMAVALVAAGMAWGGYIKNP
jgi:hypothetical protein